MARLNGFWICFCSIWEWISLGAFIDYFLVIWFEILLLINTIFNYIRTSSIYGSTVFRTTGILQPFLSFIKATMINIGLFMYIWFKILTVRSCIVDELRFLLMRFCSGTHFLYFISSKLIYISYFLFILLYTYHYNFKCSLLSFFMHINNNIHIIFFSCCYFRIHTPSCTMNCQDSLLSLFAFSLPPHRSELSYSEEYDFHCFTCLFIFYSIPLCYFSSEHSHVYWYSDYGTFA